MNKTVAKKPFPWMVNRATHGWRTPHSCNHFHVTVERETGLHCPSDDNLFLYRYLLETSKKPRKVQPGEEMMANRIHQLRALSL